ncbi:MAG: (2Fe-2S)-binding protein [Gammaproteobacteria bacterium]|nr:(2Fe-2S)-binding protein [Gammaproteobacteria bacterium]MDD9869008.1 (2Fe-2S)-binding protein [Gammaproteobacteria bacterium]
MYVCVCRAITEEQIRRAVAGGADTLAKLRETLGLGVDCGKCLEYAKRLLGGAKPGANNPPRAPDHSRRE